MEKVDELSTTKKTVTSKQPIEKQKATANHTWPFHKQKNTEQKENHEANWQKKRQLKRNYKKILLAVSLTCHSFHSIFSRGLAHCIFYGGTKNFFYAFIVVFVCLFKIILHKNYFSRAKTTIKNTFT